MTDKELIQALKGTEARSKRALLDEAANLNSSMSAADVAPVVHAQWEAVALVEVDSRGETYRIPNAGLRCPWCMCDFDKKLLWRRSYCPNCGAKMDRGADDGT